MNSKSNRINPFKSDTKPNESGSFPTTFNPFQYLSILFEQEFQTESIRNLIRTHVSSVTLSRMNPNDFQTFPISYTNPNESETNPNLPYNTFQSEINPTDLQSFSICSPYPNNFLTNPNLYFNPFES